MPPKAISSAVIPSKLGSLVPVGPRTVASKKKNQGIRDENGEKPTTTRALILRNGKYGARGTGELMLASKLSGREKLDLLAEDLVKKAQTAIMAPFNLQECLKIADSQFRAFLDDITHLRDPQLFYHIIQAESNAPTKQDKMKTDPFKNASYVASIVTTRIHNTYMLASAWNLIGQTLAHLAEVDGVTDSSIKSDIKNNAGIRTRYLVLYDLVLELVAISQAKFSFLAMRAPHYARYFKPAPDQANDPEPEMIFDWQELREAGLSFLDSIILELCFPRGVYPKDILYELLRDSIEESPKEAKRFPQQLWDAVGDLSVAVDLLRILEAPLVGPEGDALRAEPREAPPEYGRWFNAHHFSREASSKVANFKDIIFPLDKTKTKTTLDNMWKHINLNYKSVSGEDIDALWNLTAEFNATPQWHSFYLPNMGSSDSEDDDEHPARAFRAKKKPLKRLAITSGPAIESEDSMPELQSVSNSSDELDTSDEESESEEEDESDSDESGYDTEGEDELRELLREAMDTAHEADWLHAAQVEHAADADPFKNERKGNPFLKVLGSLRGRLFSSSPKLKSTTRGEAPKKPATVKPATAAAQGGPKVPKATVEDVEDEDELAEVKKKKKKKPKKKKKKTASAPTDAQDEDEDDKPASPILAPVPPPVTKAPISVPSKSTAAPPVAKKVIPTAQAPISSFLGSTSSLPLPTQTVAQSARSYLAENVNAVKSKIKSRPGFATAFAAPEKKTGFFSKFLSSVRGESEEKPQKGAKHSWFSKLSKKSKGLMHQLLNTADDEMKGIAPMKWENFLRVREILMREMGFEYDPSTAGSSVRFDPPDRRDMA
ncbi:hypothetical protein H0H93_005820 [Arthromyces matolae]|nr:hypothetical protein H0H93_005820 [Arthromyces matolae]